MGCDEIRDLLALYAGGEAYEDERETVEAHLTACASCARELDLTRESRAGLAALRDDSLPPGMAREMWEGVRSELFPGRTLRRLSWHETALRFAAALLLGGAIGVTAHFAIGSSASTVSPEMFAVEDLPAPRPVMVGTPVDPPPASFRVQPRPYLPRVEAIPASGERDF